MNPDDDKPLLVRLNRAVRLMKHAVQRVAPKWLWSRLRSWRLQRIVKSFRPYTVEHTYAGVPLKIRIEDPLARGWYDHDWGALPELEILQSSGLGPGSRVFDIGAHQGIVAMVLARLVGPNGEVVAVEALPHNARLCEVNRESNNLPWISVETAAIADRPGKIEVSIDLNAQVKNHATNIMTVRVPAVTIDGLANQYGTPDVLFIDVEGFECHALKGEAQTLRAYPNTNPPRQQGPVTDWRPLAYASGYNESSGFRIGSKDSSGLLH